MQRPKILKAILKKYLKKLQFGGNEEEKHLFKYKIIQQFCLSWMRLFQ